MVVVSNRDIRNINFLSSVFTTSLAQMAYLPSNVAMDVNKHSINNYDNVRGKNTFPSNVSSRSTSVSSSTFSIPYHERMVINNEHPNQEHVEPIDNFQLSYSSDSQEHNQDSMATILFFLKEFQHVSNKASVINTCNVDNNNVINIQLQYNLDWPMELDL